jgi:hypothetical protein
MRIWKGSVFSDTPCINNLVLAQAQHIMSMTLKFYNMPFNKAIENFQPGLFVILAFFFVNITPLGKFRLFCTILSDTMHSRFVPHVTSDFLVLSTYFLIALSSLVSSDPYIYFSETELKLHVTCSLHAY